MNKIPFFKMSGSGNDFIIIDNRDNFLKKINITSFVQAVCRRSISVGADGVILIENSKTENFAWRFYNADGSEAEMCGNGGRCAARYAVIKGIAEKKLSFETLAGIIQAEVENDRVSIELPSPEKIVMDISIASEDENHNLHFINTGVPHVVKFVENINDIQVQSAGKKIRFHPRFSPAGTNVNFVSLEQEPMLAIRTYERGVEDETLACGTGSVAAALIASALGKTTSPVKVKTKGGEILTVHMQKPSFPFGKVFLEGCVRVVCTGEIWEEAYM